MPEWNSKQDHRLYKLDDLIDDKLKLNELAVDYYSKRNEWISWPTILLGVVSTCFIFTSNSEYMKYISGGLTTVMTALASFKQFYKFETKMNTHRNSIVQYKKLERDIKETKDLDFRDREPVLTFMKKVKDTFNTLDESTPMIPLGIQKEFYKNYEKYKKLKKLTGEISEEDDKYKRKTVKVLNEETGEHESIEIVIMDEKEEKNDFLEKRLENEIDSLTNK